MLEIIQDNSGHSSFFYPTYSIDVDTAGYTYIIVDFWFYDESMEAGEDFQVQNFDCINWNIVADYDSGD